MSKAKQDNPINPQEAIQDTINLEQASLPSDPVRILLDTTTDPNNKENMDDFVSKADLLKLNSDLLTYIKECLKFPAKSHTESLADNLRTENQALKDECELLRCEAQVLRDENKSLVTAMRLILNEKEVTRGEQAPTTSPSSPPDAVPSVSNESFIQPSKAKSTRISDKRPPNKATTNVSQGKHTVKSKSRRRRPPSVSGDDCCIRLSQFWSLHLLI